MARHEGDGDAKVDLDLRDPRAEAMGDQVVRAVNRRRAEVAIAGATR